MGLSIYFRSIDSMHPAVSYEIAQQFQQRHACYAWPACEVFAPVQGTDGFLSGSVAPEFPVLDSEPHQDSHEGGLMTIVDILAELSRDYEVDWAISHDYEPETVGRIFEGVAEPELIEELEAVINIGNLFGDFMDDGEYWGEEAEDPGTWQAEQASPQLRIADDDDAPQVLKFPGLE